MVFDPVNARTLLLGPDNFETLEVISQFLGPERADVDEIVARVMVELEDVKGTAVDETRAGDRAANIRRWVEIAIRLAR